ncbi:hypothetical protein GGH97_002596, partial [Coemansia sp. RSA 475]
VPSVWRELFDMAERGHIVPVVYEPVFYGLDRTKDALKAISSRQTYGKVVVKPAESPSKL